LRQEADYGQVLSVDSWEGNVEPLLSPDPPGSMHQDLVRLPRLDSNLGNLTKKKKRKKKENGIQ